MRSLCVLIAVLLLPLSAAAAPPTLDFFYPAGGQRGTTVEVVASGSFSAWPVQAWADDTGIEIRPGKETGKFQVAIAAATPPGLHHVRLYNADGASVLRPFVVGTLPEVLEKEPNDDPRKPQVLTPGVVVNGQLEKAGDVDTFAVSARKGQTLVAAVDAQHPLGSPMDGVLQLLSADGFVRAQSNDYHGLDPLIAYPVPADGTYLVRLFAFPAVATANVGFAGGPNFNYRLTVTTGPFADYAYPPAVSRSSPGTVELIGWNLPESLRRLPVAPTDEDTVALGHAELANTVPVRVVPNPVVIGPQKLTLPATAAGKISRMETADVYAFDAKKGQKLSLRVETHELGFPLDPVLKVLDAGGKVVATAQGKKLGTDPALDFTVPQDGAYTLEVRDLHEEGGPRHVYLLHAQPVTPDYALTVVSDRFTMTPGKPLDIPITVARKGGHSEAIELAVEGLPAGIRATTVAGKTLTLRLSDAAAPFAGPLRIVGKTTPPRLARANALPHLWLTVRAN